MKIATWNVNSIKARTTHTQRWLERVRPDFLCLQELKGLEFPHGAFPEYKIHAVGQKAYNGVAILSNSSFDVILEKLPGNDADEQARYLEIQSGNLRLINIYLPNGNPWPGEKFEYKLKWMDRLYLRLKELREQEIPFIVTGDFNVIPEGRDCWDPKAWENDALYRIETRQKFRALLNLGLTDAFRALNQNDHQYTFWDYQAGCWPADKGIRIDHFLLSPPVTDRLVSCTIDREPRGEESPSDHTPVILTIKP
jgi:exodeoxyribonuclease-3